MEKEFRLEMEKIKKEVKEKNDKIYEMSSIIEENRNEFDAIKQTISNLFKIKLLIKRKLQKKIMRIQF